MNETITASCDLITCQREELKLLRELHEAVVNERELAEVNRVIEALKPWSTRYGECQL